MANDMRRVIMNNNDLEKYLYSVAIITATLRTNFPIESVKKHCSWLEIIGLIETAYIKTEKE